MLGLFITFLIISSGSLLCATFKDRKFEEILPITNVFIVFIIFIFGILGILLYGVYFVSLLSLIIYLICIIAMLKYKKAKQVLKNMVTPGFIIFILFYIMIIYLNYGRIPSSWDEFSHWADVVKAMFIYDDFSTNIELSSTFKSYPPGVSVFLYFIQEVNNLSAGITNFFSEWRLSFAYQLFVFSFFFPFFTKLKLKDFFLITFASLILFLAPSLFYSEVYTTIYADPVLGILTGIAFATIYSHNKNDFVYFLQMYAIIFSLVLAKDAGMLFAIGVLIAFILDILFGNKKEKNIFKKRYVCLGSTVSLILPKILWEYSIYINEVTKSFSGSYEFTTFFKVVLGMDDTYRSTVYSNFWDAFLTDTISIGATEINLTQTTLLLIIFALIYVATGISIRKNTENKKRYLICSITICSTYIVYYIGMLLSYMFKFSEYEALKLASYSRYLYIGMLFLFIYTLFIIMSLDIKDYFKKKTINLILGCCIFICVPWSSLADYFNKDSIDSSLLTYESYKISLQNISEFVDEDEKLYIISQETTGYDYWYIRYYSRPVKCNSAYSWSIGEVFYDGDIWTKECSAQELQEVFVESYDYVLLYKLNDYFYENFSILFENPEDIHEDGLYKVNIETGLLEICE